jgi:hypothetical protein
VRLAAVALVACGTPMPSWLPDAGPCVAYVSTANLTTPTVSFKADVMPIFAANCASASCHGIADSPQGNLFLGAQLAKGADADMVHTGLDATSVQLPTMKFVVANDPANSYLMHKLDGDQCMFGDACIGGDCMATMPFSDTMLSVDDRDTVRRWIAQGAADN